MKQLRQRLAWWWLSAQASGFDAAVQSSAMFYGVAGEHAVMPSVPAISLTQFAGAFALLFLRGLLVYFAANPLSKLFPPEPPQN